MSRTTRCRIYNRVTTDEHTEALHSSTTWVWQNWRPPKIGGPVRPNTSNMPNAGPAHGAPEFTSGEMHVAEHRSGKITRGGAVLQCTPPYFDDWLWHHTVLKMFDCVYAECVLFVLSCFFPTYSLYILSVSFYFSLFPRNQFCGEINFIYTVAQNKPDYLLLLSKFCISTTRHASMIMYM